MPNISLRHISPRHFSPTHIAVSTGIAFCLCLSLWMASAVLNIAAAHDEVELLFDQRTPSQLEQHDGATGVVAERASAAFQLAGIPFHWRKSPAQHQLRFIKADQSRQCGIDWYKTPARMAMARYSEHIAQDADYLVVSNANDSRFATVVSFNSLLDSDLRLAASTNLSFGELIDNEIRQHRLKTVESRGDDSELVAMVVNRRADYALILSNEFDAIATALGPRRDELSAHAVQDFPEPSKVYLMCSKRVDPATMEALDNAIRKILEQQ